MEYVGLLWLGGEEFFGEDKWGVNRLLFFVGVGERGGEG